MQITYIFLFVNRVSSFCSSSGFFCVSYNFNSSALWWYWFCHPVFSGILNRSALVWCWKAKAIELSALVFSFGRYSVWISTGKSILLIEIFCCFPPLRQENSEITYQLGHNRSLPHHFQLTIQPVPLELTTESYLIRILFSIFLP